MMVKSIDALFQYISMILNHPFLDVRTRLKSQPDFSPEVFDSTVATSEGEVLFKGTDVAFRKAQQPDGEYRLGIEV